jgi:hypothetical protein
LGKCTHREWYAQFVTNTVRAEVSRVIGIDRIKASTDPSFNDIPLCEWDGFKGAAWGLTQKLKEAGDYLTLSAYVCVAKEAAQQIREGK